MIGWLAKKMMERSIKGAEYIMKNDPRFKNAVIDAAKRAVKADDDLQDMLDRTHGGDPEKVERRARAMGMSVPEYINKYATVKSRRGSTPGSEGPVKAVEVGKFEDGKKHGSWAGWHGNGQKSHESTYKDGKLITAVAWKPNGDKCPVSNVVNGNGVLVRYNDDGMEDRRFFYQNGKRAF